MSVKEDCLRGGFRRSSNFISPLNMESRKKPMLFSKKWKMTGWELSTPNVFLISTMNSSAFFCPSTKSCKAKNRKAYYLYSVMRIHDILGWIQIRIRGSMPVTNGSGSGSWIRILLFSSLTFKMPAKNLLKLHLHHYLKIKSTK